MNTHIIKIESLSGYSGIQMLREAAKIAKIEGYSRMNRQQLVDALKSEGIEEIEVSDDEFVEETEEEEPEPEEDFYENPFATEAVKTRTDLLEDISAPEAEEMEIDNAIEISSLEDLMSFPLDELRFWAREYNISPNQPKPQLAKAIWEALLLEEEAIEEIEQQLEEREEPSAIEVDSIQLEEPTPDEEILLSTEETIEIDNLQLETEDTIETEETGEELELPMESEEQEELKEEETIEQPSSATEDTTTEPIMVTPVPPPQETFPSMSQKEINSIIEQVKITPIEEANEIYELTPISINSLDTASLIQIAHGLGLDDVIYKDAEQKILNDIEKIKEAIKAKVSDYRAQKATSKYGLDPLNVVQINNITALRHIANRLNVKLRANATLLSAKVKILEALGAYDLAEQVKNPPPVPGRKRGRPRKDQSREQTSTLPTTTEPSERAGRASMKGITYVNMVPIDTASNKPLAGTIYRVLFDLLLQNVNMPVNDLTEQALQKIGQFMPEFVQRLILAYSTNQPYHIKVTFNDYNQQCLELEIK